MSPLVVLVALISVLVVTIWFYVRNAFRYWQQRGVPYIKPSFPFGSLPKSFAQEVSISEEVHELYNKSSEPFVGIYSSLKPVILLRDPQLIRDVLIKDFQSFVNRDWFVNEDVDPMAKNILVQHGQEWRDSRKIFSPTFTSGKLKAMCETIINCGDSLEEYISHQADTDKSVEVRDVFARFATNVIASVVFGIDVDCIKDPKSEFRESGKRFFETKFRNAFRAICWFLAPKLGKLFRIRFVDKEVSDFMIDIVQKNLEYREKNNVIRRDFFQLLMQLRNTGEVREDDDWSAKSSSDKKLLSIEEMASQAHLFFLGGYESNSSTLSFCLYELEKRPELQQKAHDDIDSTLEKHNGQMSYDSLADMKFMDLCIEETLRMHAPFGFITRVCTKDYKLANSNLMLEKGTSVFFSVDGLHYDERYFANPNEFVPEPFDESITGKKSFVEMPFLAFGEGPRNCIGLRFGKLQAKLAVVLLLRKFRFELGDEHKGKPLKMDPRSGARTHLNGINLVIHRRKE